MADRQLLLEQIDRAVREGATGADITAVVIEAGWQPRPVLGPNSDYLEGLLDSGRRVPIEIHRGPSRRWAD